MPTVLSLGQPATAFQFAYMLYLYGLPLLLWAAFAFCVLEHDAERLRSGAAPRVWLTLLAILLPLVGAVFVLLGSAETRRRYGLVVIVGLVGLQMVALGVVGEYVWRALDEARRRPRYVVEAMRTAVGRANRDLAVAFAGPAGLLAGASAAVAAMLMVAGAVKLAPFVGLVICTNGRMFVVRLAA